MLDRIRRMGYPAFLRISLIAAFIVFTVKDLVSYARYTGAVSSGKVSELSVSLDECETLSMKKLENGAYAATDPDSQIIITADRPVAAVRLDMTTYLEPGEIPVFYTRSEGERFTDNNRRWAHPNGEGGYSVLLNNNGYTYVYRLRIDPTVYAGNRIEIKDITLNPRLAPGDFLCFDAVFLARTFFYGVLVSLLLKELFSHTGEEKA